MQVVNRHRVFDDAVAEVVGGPVGDAAPNASACQPD